MLVSCKTWRNPSRVVQQSCFANGANSPYVWTLKSWHEQWSHASSRPTDAETRHNLNGSCDRPTKHTGVVFAWGHLIVRSHGLADIIVKKTYCLHPLDINISGVVGIDSMYLLRNYDVGLCDIYDFMAACFDVIFLISSFQFLTLLAYWM